MNIEQTKPCLAADSWALSCPESRTPYWPQLKSMSREGSIVFEAITCAEPQLQTINPLDNQDTESWLLFLAESGWYFIVDLKDPIAKSFYKKEEDYSPNDGLKLFPGHWSPFYVFYLRKELKTISTFLF